jgi:hypothetical protein
MKKLVATTVIAIVGLLKLSNNSIAWEDEDDFGFGLPSGLTSVHINLSVLSQGKTNTVDGTTFVHFKQSKIDDGDILGLINNEFGTSFSETNGDHLAVSNFWDGQLIVLGKTNNILLANASANTNGDHFQLGFSSANTVFASTATTNCLTKFSVADGFLKYESGDGSNSFSLEGLTTVNDSYFHGLSNSVESFQLSGGIGSISSTDTNGVSGVLTGSASGSGKNNAPPL